MGFNHSRTMALLPFLIFFSLAGCLPTKQARIAAVAYTAEDVFKAAVKQPDPTVVRRGSPAYLMLIDGLIEADPHNGELLTAGCHSYTSYASSFIEETDSAKAAILYAKAKDYGFRALSTKGNFQRAAAGRLDGFNTLLGTYEKEDVPALFCTCSAWAKWISHNVDSVEALADLPMLEATIKRVIELDGSYHYGSPHVLMAVYLALKPTILGGDMAEAKDHFDKAFALGADKLLSAKVLFAKYYAARIKNRDLFEKTLQHVIEAPVDEVRELTLSNALAKEEARKLLEKEDEYFVEVP